MSCTVDYQLLTFIYDVSTAEISHVLARDDKCGSSIDILFIQSILYDVLRDWIGNGYLMPSITVSN